MLELKYNAPVIKALPSLSVDGFEDFAPKYLSSKLSKADSAAFLAVTESFLAVTDKSFAATDSFLATTAASLATTAAAADAAALTAVSYTHLTLPTKRIV